MSSLHAVLLKLRPEADGTIPPTHGHNAYAMFMELMQRSNPKLAAELHSPSPLKPFTLSPLQGKFQRVSKDLLGISAGADYFFRLTFLRGDVFAYFMDAVLKSAGHTLRVSSATFLIDCVVSNKSESSECGHQDYEEVLSLARPSAKVSLQFLTPTAFRSGGKRNVLFPEAKLVFNSYFSKWQRFSPVKLSESITKYWQDIILARYKCATRILDFGTYQETGFQGNCVFELPDFLNEDELRALNALADFAFYCGTGAKTTMGMGQTRRLR